MSTTSQAAAIEELFAACGMGHRHSPAQCNWGRVCVCDRPRCYALLPGPLPALQAFKCMPPAVRSRLAKACQGLQLPPGALVFEEDDKGDAMYVVVAGCLQVRVVTFPLRVKNLNGRL